MGENYMAMVVGRHKQVRQIRASLIHHTHTHTQTKPKRNRRRWRRQPNHPDRGEKAAGCRHQSDRWDRHHHGHFADNQERRLIYSQRDHSAWSCIPVPKFYSANAAAFHPERCLPRSHFPVSFPPFFFHKKAINENPFVYVISKGNARVGQACQEIKPHPKLFYFLL